MLNEHAQANVPMTDAELDPWLDTISGTKYALKPGQDQFRPACQEAPYRSRSLSFRICNESIFLDHGANCQFSSVDLVLSH